MTTFAAPDPLACPSCSARITPDATSCAACGLALRGPAALRLWQVSVDLARLAQEREQLLVQLRGGAGPAGPTGPAPAAAPAAAARRVPDQAAYAPTTPPAAWPASVSRPVPQRREWTAQRVQNLLLGLGVLLVVVAAVIFAAVAWGRLGDGGRAAVLAGATLAVGWGAAEMRRRDLTATAEALAALAVLVALVDALAVRRVGLLGLDDVDLASYWAGAVAVIAAVAALYSGVVPLRAPRWSAVVGAQLVLPIVALGRDDIPDSWRAVAIGAQSAAVQGSVVSLWRRQRDYDLVGLGAFGAAAAAVVSVGIGLGVAYGDAPSSGAAALLVPAASLALGSWLWGDAAREARALLSAAATAVLVLAAFALAVDRLTEEQLPAAAAALGLAVVVAAATMPAAFRFGPTLVGAGTATLATLAVAIDVAAAVLLPFGWLDRTWRLRSASTPAREALSPDVDWDGTVVALVVLLVAIATALFLSELARRRHLAAVPVAVTAALAVVVLPLGLAWSYGLALVWDTAVGVLLAGAVVPARRWRPHLATPIFLAGTAVLAVSVAWSLAHETATVLTVGAVALGFAVVAAADAGLRPASAALAALAVCGEVAAVTASLDAGVARTGFAVAVAGAVVAAIGQLLRGVGDGMRTTGSAVLAVGAGAYGVALLAAGSDAGWLSWALLAGAVTAALLATVTARPEHPDGVVRAGYAAGAGALACGWTGTLAISRDTPTDRTGFVVAATAGAVVLLAALLRKLDDISLALEVTGAGAYVVGLAASATDPGWASWTLALGGIVALVDALRPERREVAWLGGLLLTGCSWVRLALEDVRAPEAYAAPLAATALVLGYLRRRRQPDTSSWAAYGSGLGLALGPSLAVAVGDPGIGRPLGLAAVALAVVIAGASQRLQAPIVIGGVVLAVDALAQVAPYAAGLPRWVTFGSAGVLLLVIGATFEQRRRDVARLRERYDSLD